jgi:hypothetical protein
LTEAELLSYAGVATGVIGAVTGIAGAVMGFISYRRTNEMKTLDLRLELMKLLVQLFHQVDSVGELIERAERSRQAVAAATGMRKSGAFERWLKQVEADRESLGVINEAFEELNVDHSAASATDLESKIVEAHALKTTLDAMHQKYSSALAEDDAQRGHIRESSRSRIEGSAARHPLRGAE